MKRPKGEKNREMERWKGGEMKGWRDKQKEKWINLEIHRLTN